MVAVDNELCAVDGRTQYRPHIIPANTSFSTHAVDAVGILRGFYIGSAIRILLREASLMGRR